MKSVRLPWSNAFIKIRKLSRDKLIVLLEQTNNIIMYICYFILLFLFRDSAWLSLWFLAKINVLVLSYCSKVWIAHSPVEEKQHIQEVKVLFTPFDFINISMINKYDEWFVSKERVFAGMNGKRKTGKMSKMKISNGETIRTPKVRRHENECRLKKKPFSFSLSLSNMHIYPFRYFHFRHFYFLPFSIIPFPVVWVKTSQSFWCQFSIKIIETFNWWIWFVKSLSQRAVSHTETFII